ncbi:hypothetical protein ISN45_Aa05g016840 [Arabidopsis thaliana x Arabidopsis arenosa]|uniref:Uncharacterized protein n=1 Tax=Arabidopsis thaliana x Arabidopsis arenosa TaxID=1240361 RepID=A0A8T1ZPN6_9BRAS|nr:hypothetical protein ISN45_Aa05g016840 [Arabidopsis thaliana x Arabidopsis arenosa]
MASSGVVNLLGKREAKDDDLETKLILKKHKNKSEETTKGFAEIKGRVELFETKSDQAPLKSPSPRLAPTYETGSVTCNLIASRGYVSLLKPLCLFTLRGLLDR